MRHSDSEPKEQNQGTDMHLEFEITLEDLKELQKVWFRNRPGRKAGTGRGLIGWFLFIGLVLGMVWLLNSQRQTPPATVAPVPPAQQADPLNHFILPVVPWLVLIVALWFFVYRRTFGAGLKTNKAFMKQISMEVDDLGIFSSDGPTQTRWQWNAFDRLIETKQRFFLRLTNSREYVLVPKRAVPAPSLDDVRRLLEKAGHNVTGAFPVVALTPREDGSV
jgi:hypothetical protein